MTCKTCENKKQTETAVRIGRITTSILSSNGEKLLLKDIEIALIFDSDDALNDSSEISGLKSSSGPETETSA
jgi:hypothetical protein